MVKMGCDRIGVRIADEPRRRRLRARRIELARIVGDVRDVRETFKRRLFCVGLKRRGRDGRVSLLQGRKRVNNDAPLRTGGLHRRRVRNGDAVAQKRGGFRRGVDRNG